MIEDYPLFRQRFSLHCLGRESAVTRDVKGPAISDSGILSRGSSFDYVSLSMLHGVTTTVALNAHSADFQNLIFIHKLTLRKSN